MMFLSCRKRIWPAGLVSAALLLAWLPAHAKSTLMVNYAGSMGTVMDQGLGPAFAKSDGTAYRGIGNGSYALARLLASKQQLADVFVSITPGPMKVLEKAGLIDHAVPVATTEMVIAYNPGSRFAKEFRAAAAGKMPWYKALEQPGLQFGRTNPLADPQGDNIVLTFLLAERYYHKPDLVRRILGPIQNPAQINGEASVITRLQAGQLDAGSAYMAEAISRDVPFLKLPGQINLGEPAKYGKLYREVHFSITGPDGKPRRESVQPLVYYAAVLNNAPNPKAARAFVQFLRSSAGRKLFKQYGYGPPAGKSL